MKKLFVMLMALTVFAVPAAAEMQWLLPAQQKVNKKVANIMSQKSQKITKMHADVLANLKSFRAAVEKRTQYNGSYIIQDMMGLMDSYLALANTSEDAAVSLNDKINQPIKAGWGRTVTVAQLVRDNSNYVVSGTSTADDLDRFEYLLGKKPVVSNLDSFKKALARYDDLMRWVNFTRTQPYNEQSFDNTVMPLVIDLMKAHNDLKAANPEAASILGDKIMKGNFDVPAFIDRFAYGWPDKAAALEDYAAYLRTCKK